MRHACEYSTKYKREKQTYFHSAAGIFWFSFAPPCVKCVGLSERIRLEKNANAGLSTPGPCFPEDWCLSAAFFVLDMECSLNFGKESLDTTTGKECSTGQKLGKKHFDQLKLYINDKTKQDL